MDDVNMQLGRLAMKFRGCLHSPKRDEERAKIKEEYATEVDRLIKAGNWDEAPAFEDMLPHDFMPKTFFEYWR